MTDKQSGANLPTPATDPAPSPASAARIVYFIMLLGSLVLVSVIFVPVWKPVVLGAVLAATLFRYYQKFAARLGRRKSLSAILMTIGVLLFILLPLGGVLSFLVVQGTQAAKVIADLIHSSAGFEEVMSKLPESVANLVRQVLEIVPIDMEQISERAAQGGKWAATTVGGLLSMTSALVFNLGLALISFYFFLVDGPQLVRWLAEVLPLKDRQTYEVLDDFRQMAKAVIGSNIIVGGTQAIVAGIGYAIAPVPHAIFFALLTFLASFIPSVGTAIVSVPLVLLMLITGHPVWAIFLGVWCLGIVGAVDNILRPILLRGAGHIHGAIVFFSLIGGIAIFGPMGLIVGPLAITFVLAMIRLWQRDFNPQTHVPQSVLDDVPRQITAESVR